MHQILPASMAYAKALCDGILSKQKLGIPCNAEISLAEKISAATDRCYEKCENLRHHLKNIPEDSTQASFYYHDTIVSEMAALRKDADLLEQLTDKSYWPYPTYSDLLYY